MQKSEPVDLPADREIRRRSERILGDRALVKLPAHDRMVKHGVRRITPKDIFGLDPTAAQPGPATHARANERGGRAVFVPAPTKDSLKIVLDQHLAEPDVRFLAEPALPEGPTHFSYLHKVKDGRDVFYFSNSTDHAIETDVLVRGAFTLQIWNPHTGTIGPVEPTEIVREKTQVLTRFHLSLPPVRSLFVVGLPSDQRPTAKP